MRAGDDVVRDHVTDILFDPNDMPDKDCMLCRQGVAQGVWAEFGYPDPFTAEDDDDD